MRIRGLVTAGLLTLATPASAEVKAARTDGFTVTLVRTVKGTPAEAWAALLRWGSWWSGEHSYSGTAANFTLDPHAGGCLCERWAGGEVAHGRVLMLMPPSTLRLDAPLGPLQGLAGSSVLTVTLTPASGSTRIAIDLRAAGSAADAYDTLAGPVDAVLTVQADRLARLIGTGKP